MIDNLSDTKIWEESIEAKRYSLCLELRSFRTYLVIVMFTMVLKLAVSNLDH